MLKDQERSPLHKFHRYTRASGVCGIEVETEFLRINQNMPDALVGVWNAHADGSLRHQGVEYTMFKPMTGHAKSKAVVDLCSFITAQAYVKDSPRTSVHAHINVQKLLPIHIWNAITLYWLLEPMLMEHCGQERVGNVFCLRMIDAENLIEVACRDLQGRLPFDRFRGNDEIRYAGLNLQPLRSFGSLEFRGMRGEYDPTLINEWTDFLIKLVHSVSHRWASPESILDEVFHTSREEFFKKVMGDYYASIAKPHYNDVKEQIEEGIEALLPFAYFHDWTAWQAKMEANLVKEKDKKKAPPFGDNMVRAGAQVLNVGNLEDAVQALRGNDERDWRIVANVHPAEAWFDDALDFAPAQPNPIRR